MKHPRSPIPPLDLPGWTVLDSGREADGRLWYRAEIDDPGPLVCPACGGPCGPHGSDPQAMRDLAPGPGGGPATILFDRPRRRCAGSCGVASVPVPGQAARHPRLTARLADRVAAELRAGRSRLDVAAEAGLSRATVAAIGDGTGIPGRGAGRPVGRESAR